MTLRNVNLYPCLDDKVLGCEGDASQNHCSLSMGIGHKWHADLWTFNLSKSASWDGNDNDMIGHAPMSMHSSL